MEAQYREFVSKFGSDYEEDKKATLAAAIKYQPDMETLALAVEEAVEWLCSYRGDEPENVGPEMFDAAIKAAVGAKDGGEDAQGEAMSDACCKVFDNALREVREGTRAMAPDEDTLAT